MNRLFPLFLAVVLVIGGEYKITHLSGRTSFCKIKSITEEGDYVVQHPKKILGYNNGNIPIIQWNNKEDILLSFIDIGEAKLLKAPPTPSQDKYLLRLKESSGLSKPLYEKTAPADSELSKPIYEK
jgi:hypothetical protein